MKAVTKKRRKNRAGFTLAETLIAVLILVMVSGIVAGALPAASSAYTKTVDAANAQILLSTAVTVLREELSTAADAHVEIDNKTIRYNGDTGKERTIAYLAATSTDPAGLYITYTREVGDPEKRLLVSEAAATKDMIFDYTSVSIGADTITFTGLTVTKAGYTDASGKLIPLASQATYVIRKVS